MINMLLTGFAATSFEFVPKYSENIRAPTATIAAKLTNTTAAQLVSIQWPLCDREATTKTCGTSDAFISSFEYLKQYLVCEKDYSLHGYPIWQCLA